MIKKIPKINLIFKNDDVEKFRFSTENELLIFITNPFKIGLGYKFKSVDRPNEGYYNLIISSYRFTLKHFLYSPLGMWGKTVSKIMIDE